MSDIVYESPDKDYTPPPPTLRGIYATAVAPPPPLREIYATAAATAAAAMLTE
jgi:hypothetical protein